MVDEFRKSETIPLKHKMAFRGSFIMVGQNFRCTPDEIDILENMFFKEQS